MSDTPQSTAIEELETLGLSTYAARTLVALVSLDGGTAREIGTVSDVPRTRVYDAAGELSEAGLATIEESTPRQFLPVSTDAIERTFTQMYLDRIETLAGALDVVAEMDHHQ
jgi:sugar-specific transcriptional regulator TrmB